MKCSASQGLQRYLPLAGLMLLPATDALAGSATSASESPDSDSIGEVIVTGTRIPTSAADSTTFVTVLNRDDIERQGAHSIGQVLQRLPLNTGSPSNANVNEGGDGSERVDLRGLGPERTLVLLNGRRFPNGGIGGDSSVDLAALPLSWIDRVEVYAGGASAVHGADAVSGVINVITREPAAGVEIGGSGSITGHGDGAILRGDAMFGWNTAGGAWSLGLDHAEQDGVTLDRRSYSAQPLGVINQDGDVGFDGSIAIPGGLFEVPAGNALGLPEDFHTRVAGAIGRTAANYRRFTLADAFNFAPFNYSQTPYRRSAVWLLGSGPLLAGSRFFVEGLAHRRHSSQRAAPDSFFSRFDPAPALANGRSGIPADNFYNPFGVDITFATRRFVEGGNRHISEELELWRVLLGVEGAARHWEWRLSAGVADSSAEVAESGLFSRTRIQLALGPSGPDANGNIVCGPRDPVTGLVLPASIVPGCVPLDVFGGAGTITPAQLEYLSPQTLLNRGRNNQRVTELSFRGQAGRLFGRSLDWALGAEYRRESGELRRDPLQNFGFFGLVDAEVSGGSFSARELFAEIRLAPALEPGLARGLGLRLGLRASDFSSFGQHLSGQAGLLWRIDSDVSVRASVAQIFRAPRLAELYEARVATVAVAPDPCGNDPSPAQQENCAAHGVPGGSYQQGSATMLTLAGGNPELRPESGTAIGAGLVYRPSTAPALTLSIDGFSVELDDFIGVPTLADVLFECAERGSRPVCEIIWRRADGSVSDVVLLRRNFGRLAARGIDFGGELALETRGGTLQLRLLATYLDSWDDQPFPGGEVFRRAGSFSAQRSLPQWRASGGGRWQSGPWRFGYSVEYVGQTRERLRDGPLFGTLFDPFVRTVGSAWYHDLDFGLELSNGVELAVTIQNAADKDPPFIHNAPLANTDTATYRLLGRTIRLAIRYRARD